MTGSATAAGTPPATRCVRRVGPTSRVRRQSPCRGGCGGRQVRGRDQPPVQGGVAGHEQGLRPGRAARLDQRIRRHNEPGARRQVRCGGVAWVQDVVAATPVRPACARRQMRRAELYAVQGQAVTRQGRRVTQHGSTFIAVPNRLRPTQMRQGPVGRRAIGRCDGERVTPPREPGQCPGAYGGAQIPLGQPRRHGRAGRDHTNPAQLLEDLRRRHDVTVAPPARWRAGGQLACGWALITSGVWTVAADDAGSRRKRPLK